MRATRAAMRATYCHARHVLPSAPRCHACMAAVLMPAYAPRCRLCPCSPVGQEVSEAAPRRCPKNHAQETVVLVGAGHTMGSRNGRALDSTPAEFDMAWFKEMVDPAGPSMPNVLASDAALLEVRCMDRGCMTGDLVV